MAHFKLLSKHFPLVCQKKIHDKQCIATEINFVTHSATLSSLHLPNPLPHSHHLHDPNHQSSLNLILVEALLPMEVK